MEIAGNEEAWGETPLRGSQGDRDGNSLVADCKFQLARFFFAVSDFKWVLQLTACPGWRCLTPRRENFLKLESWGVFL